MLIIQFFLILFFLFALSRVILRFRKEELTIKELFFWVFFWVLAGFVAIWPDSTFIISNFVGISRGADLVVYISLAVLFFLVFKISVRLEKINKNITKIIREKTLKDE